MPSCLKYLKLRYYLWRCERLVQKAEKNLSEYSKLRAKILALHKRAKELCEELRPEGEKR